VIFQKEGLQLPKEVFPCPIVETVCEVRFEPHIPLDAVFGAAYAKLAPIVGNALRLPVLMLPPEVREHDPNLRFQPHYRFKKDNYSIQLGPRMFSVTSRTPYPGWPRFSEMVKAPIEALKNAGVIGSVVRLGLRYINFIDGNVFDKIDVELRVNSTPVSAKETSLALVVEHRYTHLVRIRKDVMVKTGPENKSQFGSVIDIDSFITNPQNGLNSFGQFLQDAHDDEKMIFFGMLKTEFLRKLNPKY